jgi:hypothetical protein
MQATDTPRGGTTPLRAVVWRRNRDNASLEYAVLSRTQDGYELRGDIVAAHDGEPVRVSYRLRCGADWRSRDLACEQRRGVTEAALRLAVDAGGRWSLNGTPVDGLSHCTDIDLGLTPSTNSLPVNRLSLSLGERAEITAAWVLFPSLEVVPAAVVRAQGGTALPVRERGERLSGGPRGRRGRASDCLSRHLGAHCRVPLVPNVFGAPGAGYPPWRGRCASTGAAQRRCDHMARLAAALCAIALAALPAAAQGQGSYLVSAGAGIGAIKLGMSIGMASAMLGAPERRSTLQEPALPPPDGARAYAWPDRHLVVETNGSGTIYYVAATADAATTDGLGCGSNMDEVQERLGVPSRSFPVGHSIRMVYDELGIQFSVSMVVGTDSYHRVEAVGVFSPSQ